MLYLVLGAPWPSEECVVYTLRHRNVKCVDLDPICTFPHGGGGLLCALVLMYVLYL